MWKNEIVNAYYRHHDVPVEPLVGMLEMIKHTMVSGRLAQQAAAQMSALAGPDGKPLRKSIIQ